jgi:hypothetical protein
MMIHRGASPEAGAATYPSRSVGLDDLVDQEDS